MDEVKMPTITVNRKYLESLLGKKISEEKLKERISMLGTDLKEVTKEEITVEIFPNRPDMLSTEGFARALSSFIGAKTGLRRYHVKHTGENIIIDKSVTMRPYTACAIVKNLKLNDEKLREIIQLQEKLATTHGRNRKKSAYGIYQLKSIHFPVHYKALDPKTVKFEPLGMNRTIKASDIEELHPKAREYKHIAEGWKKYPFFIDAKQEVMSMLPYINSNRTGRVDLETKELFVESSGTQRENVERALNIICTALADMGGEIYTLDMKYPYGTRRTPNLEPETKSFNLEKANKWLGLELKEKEVKELFERMGYSYERGKVKVPAYRTDILHEVDLYEDLAIAYGYENFKEEIPNVSTIAEEDTFVIFKRRVQQRLIGLGLLETNTHHLIGEEFLELVKNPTKPVKLKNALNKEYTLLRSWMIPSLLEVLKNNLHNEYPQRIFEIGRCFKEGDTETGVEEFERLAVIVSGKEETITTIKQVLDNLCNGLNLTYEIEETEHPTFITGRVGRILIHKKKLAYFGEIHPEVLCNLGIEWPTFALEINLTELNNV